MKTSPMHYPCRRTLCAAVFFSAVLSCSLIIGAPKAQAFLFFGPPKSRHVQRQTFVSHQKKPHFNDELLQQASPGNTKVVISLSQQRVYLMVNGGVAIDGPICSGRQGRSTPTGTYPIQQKDINHYSSLYGDYVDRGGRVVRGGVSAGCSSAPSGTHFRGAPMHYFMRLTSGGIGMHEGFLPGFPASHGCIRMPGEVAGAIYSRVGVGTTVQVKS